MRVTITIFLIGLALLGIEFKVLAAENQRFEHIYSSEWIHVSGLNGNGDKLFSVFHDHETGNEIICVDDNRGGPSCFLSGRSWK